MKPVIFKSMPRSRQQRKEKCFLLVRRVLEHNSIASPSYVLPPLRNKEAGAPEARRDDVAYLKPRGELGTMVSHSAILLSSALWDV